MRSNLQGIPWIQVAAKNLKETRTKGIISPHVVPTPIAGRLGGASSDFMNIEKKKNRGDKKSSSTSSSSSFRLPQPTQGPNATLPQAFHIWFTHREEVPLVTHALDLFHGHDDATAAMPLDKINPTRVWKTSEIIPFLGHVSLERMECAIDGDDNDDEDGGNRETQSLVRIIVNGSPQEQPACHSGPGGSCPFEEFLELVDKLPEVYGKLKEVCQQEEDE